MKNIRDLLNLSGKRNDGAQEGGKAGPHPLRTKVVVGVASVLAVFVVLAAIAPLVVDLNKYKGQILARIRPAVHRDVDFESVGLTVLTGIGAELKGFRVPENPAFAQGDFVSVDSVKVKVKFLPLLRGQVRIARLVFDSPAVHVRRNPQGVFNFADMVPPKKEKEEKSKMPAILASLGISDLSVKNGSVLYEDLKVPAGTPPADAALKGKRITVGSLDADIENISMTDAVTVDVRGILFGGKDTNFKLTGKVGPVGLEPKDSPIPVDLVLETESLPLKELTEGLGLSTRAASGLMTGNVTVRGSVKGKMDTVSRISVTNLVLQPKPGAAALANVRPAAVDLSGRIAYDGQPKDVTIQDLTLAVGPSKFAVAGTVRHVSQKPAWSISLKSTALDMGSLLASAPAFGTALPANLRLAGPAKLQLSTAGTSGEMTVTTGMDLSPAEISMGNTFHKSPGVACTLATQAGISQGVLSFRSLGLVLHNLMLSGAGEVGMKAKPAELNIRLASKPANLKGWDSLIPSMKSFGLGGDMTLKADITGTSKAPRFALQASSSQLGLTLPPSKTKKDAKPTPVSLNGMSLAVQGGTLEKKLSADGTFGLGGGRYADIALGKTSAKFSFAKGKLDVPSLGMSVLGGTVNGSATYVAASKDWTFSPVIKGINAGQAMNTFTSFKDVFTGTLSGRMQIRGNSGKKGPDSLATQGTVSIEKGTMNNLDILQSTIDGLTGVPGLSGLVAEQGAVQRSKQTKFDSLAADFGFARKVLTVQSMKLNNIYTGKETNSLATLQGTVDMTTRKVNFKGGVEFSPEYSARLAKRTPAISALQNDRRRIDLPIQITGSVNRPVLFLQTSTIAQAVANYYARQGVEKGLEKLKKKLNIPGSGSSGNNGQTGKQDGKGTGSPVDDFLKGVLGK